MISSDGPQAYRKKVRSEGGLLLNLDNPPANLELQLVRAAAFARDRVIRGQSVLIHGPHAETIARKTALAYWAI